MSLMLSKIQLFLDAAAKGESVGIPPSLIEEFKEACGNALERQFNRKNEFRLRMSGVGKPLCQQQLGMKKGVNEELDYTSIMRFLFGDLIEAVAIVVMKAAGINIEKEQEPVKLKIGGTVLKGTYDVKIDGKVWDIKSASPASFASKFGANGGYFNIKENDPFGYVTQGYLYAEAAKSDFGGWIAINKSTGEWAVCETPDLQEQDKKDVLEDADNKVRYLLSNKKFKRCFDDLPEYYKDKVTKSLTPTGNRLLSKDCSYCGYRKHCWPGSTLEYKVTSNASNKPMVWYSKFIKKEL